MKLYTLRESRRGGDELRTSGFPSNFAPIATKLRQRAFQTICKFRFFDVEKFFRKKFRFFFRFFIIFDRFSRSSAFSDVKIEFLEIFCFRWSNL